jgi:hypothetical protein
MTKELRRLAVPPQTIAKIWAIVIAIPVVFRPRLVRLIFVFVRALHAAKDCRVRRPGIIVDQLGSAVNMTGN